MFCAKEDFFCDCDDDREIFMKNQNLIIGLWGMLLK